MLLAEYVRNFLSEEVTQKDKILNLQPDDYLLVYHGTGEAYAEMINGIDATREHHRDYNSQRHEGIFVTTDPDLALGFASYGQVVLEILVQAKNLMGTDYGGNTSEKQIAAGAADPDEIWKDYYPNSFSPYLTSSLLQKHEPQALFVGIIQPEQIKRVQWKGEWHSRDELLDSQPEYSSYSSRDKKTLKKLQYNPTDGNISIEEFFKIVGDQQYGKDSEMNTFDNLSKVFQYFFERYSEISGNFDELAEEIVKLGWRHNAAKKIADKLRKHYS